MNKNSRRATDETQIDTDEANSPLSLNLCRSVFHLWLIIILLLLTTMANGLCSAAEPTADFYVSPEGSDAWSGTLSAPNVQRTDGPFATLERARDAVWKSGKSCVGDVVVLVRGGTYRLTKTVVFGLQDSGRGDSTITYAAYPSETPVFSSGQEINEWKLWIQNC
jgi:hypothetical protein